MKDQSLPQQSRNSGRDCAWWTNSPVHQFLHQLPLAQNSRSIQYRQNIPRPNQFFLIFFFREDQTLLHRPGNSGREYISCTKFKIHLVQQTVPWPKHFFAQFLGRTSLCFTDQETQEENVFGQDQLPCGSVLTPAISCTKFEIHLAHADSPMAKPVFLLNF